MARVYKHTYTVRDEDGSRVQRKTKKWYGRYSDLLGRTRRVPLCTDKQASQRAVDALTDALDRTGAGMVVRPIDLPPPVQKHSVGLYKAPAPTVDFPTNRKSRWRSMLPSMSCTSSARA